MRRHSQQGNAVIFILLAIALFGALAFTFLSGSRSGMSNLSANQAKLLANDILGYATSLERGTQKLLSRGCSELQLEYDPNMSGCGGETNPDTPPDNSCKLFDPAGAGLMSVSYQDKLPPNATVTVSGGASFEDVGTYDPNDAFPHQEIVLWVGPIDLNLCNALNQALGNNFDPPDIPNSIQNWCYHEELVANEPRFGNTILNDLGPLAGKKAGCFNQTDPQYNGFSLDQGYEFYYVLYER